MKAKIREIIDKAVGGGEIDEAEIKELFMVPPISEEAFSIMYWGRKMSEEAEPNVPGAMAGASLFWAENGSNPRDTTVKTEAGRGCSIARCREIFREAGWEVLDGPSRIFG